VPPPSPRRPAVLALLLILLFLGPACQRELMRPPVMFHYSQADPFSELPESQHRTSASIFYATNRIPDPTSKELPYGVARSSSLLLGEIDVRIGRDLSWQELTEDTLGNPRSRRPPLSIDRPHQYGPLLTTAPPRLVRREMGQDIDAAELRYMLNAAPGEAAQRFAHAVNAEMQATDHAEVYVYVHGYRNSFVDAVESAASLHHYNGRRGAVVAFSWPSQQHLLDYLEDREAAVYSVSDFRQLLVFLAEHTDAERINLIAHSMGTYLTASTLREIRLIGYDESPQQLHERFRIDNVVLVAPDIDAGILGKRFFREGFHHVPRRMTIYTSPDDQALSWATRLLYGLTRAGSMTDDSLSDEQRFWLRAHPEVSIIDISGQKTYGLGHSHHTENPGVASDLLLLLAHDLPPAERGLIQVPEHSVWTFPDNYDQRVRAIAEEHYPRRLPVSCQSTGSAAQR
jgi:esterase/lipase superfamily enzyme